MGRSPRTGGMVRRNRTIAAAPSARQRKTGHRHPDDDGHLIGEYRIQHDLQAAPFIPCRNGYVSHPAMPIAQMMLATIQTGDRKNGSSDHEGAEPVTHHHKNRR
jgi:hypothetical protein